MARTTRWGRCALVLIALTGTVAAQSETTTPPPSSSASPSPSPSPSQSPSPSASPSPSPSSSPSPWIDQSTSPIVEPAPPTRERSRRWRVLAAAMLGMRGDQGGLIDSGYRFVAIGGIIHPQFSFSLAIDRQLGDDNRIRGASSPARFSEWMASARIGRAFRIGPDFWMQGALGLARVNSRITRIDNMRSTERANLGMDAVATIVWRSGLIASTLVFGVTAIPAEEQVVIDGATYIVPERIEPWFGLGIALMF